MKHKKLIKRMLATKASDKARVVIACREMARLLGGTIHHITFDNPYKSYKR
jgi:hypothetical protein